jgi:hypothetical protein
MAVFANFRGWPCSQSSTRFSLKLCIARDLLLTYLNSTVPVSFVGEILNMIAGTLIRTWILSLSIDDPANVDR